MNPNEKLNLYDHNIISSQKVKTSFNKGNQIVSIIQATGTGKTYVSLDVVLYYLNISLYYKYKNIIWIEPSKAIIEQVEETIKECNLSLEEDFPNLKFRTYQSFINMTREEIKNIPCDFLIIDEIHHLGAPVWGERIRMLIETHPNIKILGMTAYTVRDRGTSYERDITNPDTNEIFSNSVVNVYDLYDAIIDGILPKPIYKTVITEDDEIVKDIERQIELLKRKGDSSYKEYEKMILDIKKMIHKQQGIKDLINQSIKPNGKYIYFCPVNSEEGKNDINSIMEEMKNNLKEIIPEEKIVFYKSTSADGDQGKYNRDCFYNDIDLDGNNASDSLRIIFVKNQYNEGVHAPNVDGVFLGRTTKSDIVAFEQIGRALTVRGNTKEKIEEYLKYSQKELKELALSRGINTKDNESKLSIIEKLISPIIIDLADNISFIEELETNLKDRVKEIQKKSLGTKRKIKIHDTTINIEVLNKDILNVLKKVKETLSRKTWEEMYELAKIYYEYHGNTEILQGFKTKNGYEYDETGVNLGSWITTQRRNQENLTEERKQKLELIDFRFEVKRNNMTWEEMYDLAKIYYDYHENTEIPSKCKCQSFL